MNNNYGAVYLNNLQNNNEFKKYGAVFANSGKYQEEEPEEESLGKSALRTALQIPQGLAEGTGYGIGTGLWEMVGRGESLDLEEIERIREISEREGVPFDEEKYRESVEQAASTIPTVSNIAKFTEEKTGIPLEAKNKLQKAVRLGSTAGKITPGGIPQKAVSSLTAPATSLGLQELGVPESISDIAGLGIGNIAGSKASVNVKTKPSGFTERQFENIKKPRSISESKKQKINQSLESDFRKITDDIISKSPIENTKNEMIQNPSFKNEVRERFAEVENLSKSIPENLHTDVLKKNLADNLLRNKKEGFLPSEYEKDFNKRMSSFIKETPKKEISPYDLVKQYRKNNQQLGEYFSPGESKAFNRAKKDSLLEYNKAIADTIKKQYPNSEFSNLFESTNKKWSEISDFESITDFIDDIFEKGVDFKKAKKIFESENQARPFKKALGNNFKDFEQVMKDLLTTEVPYKMLKEAKSKGFGDLYSSAGAYIIHPKLGIAKHALSTSKKVYEGLINSMLDKPKISLTWKSAMDDLKKGKFKQATDGFRRLEKEISESNSNLPQDQKYDEES